MVQPIRTRRRRKARRAKRRQPEYSRAPTVTPSKPPDEAPPLDPPDRAPSSGAPPSLDIDAMTKREIMAELDRRGIQYQPRSNRKTLASALWTANMLGDDDGDSG